MHLAGSGCVADPYADDRGDEVVAVSGGPHTVSARGEPQALEMHTLLIDTCSMWRHKQRKRLAS